MPGGQINDLSLGKHHSLPLATPLSPSQTFEGLFWGDMVLFRGPRLALCVASGTAEKQGHCQVCRARRGGPRTPSHTTDANLDCVLKTHTNPCLRKVNRIEMSQWPDLERRRPRLWRRRCSLCCSQGAVEERGSQFWPCSGVVSNLFFLFCSFTTDLPDFVD